MLKLIAAASLLATIATAAPHCGTSNGQPDGPPNISAPAVAK